MNNKLVSSCTMVLKDAWLKVHGKAKYNDDDCPSACLQARLLTSACARGYSLCGRFGSLSSRRPPSSPAGTARTDRIDTAEHADTGSRNCGISRAHRHRGGGRRMAGRAGRGLRVEYQPLPIVNTIEDALASQPTLVHPADAVFRAVPTCIRGEPISPYENKKRRHGSGLERQRGGRGSRISHSAGQPRLSGNAEHPGTDTSRRQVVIHTANQAPHAVTCSRNTSACRKTSPWKCRSWAGLRRQINPHPELLAYIASRAVGGRQVRLAYTREEASTPPLQDRRESGDESGRDKPANCRRFRRNITSTPGLMPIHASRESRGGELRRVASPHPVRFRLRLHQPCLCHSFRVWPRRVHIRDQRTMDKLADRLYGPRGSPRSTPPGKVTIRPRR